MSAKTLQAETQTVTNSGHTGTQSISGVSFWKWTASAAKWIMVEDRSDPGFVPGMGPTQEGRFDGQTLRWISIPSQ
jgi:hypothetical protein